MNRIESAPARVAAHVDEARLWQRHVAMAAFGGTAKGGVNRQALSPEDAQARTQLIRWAQELGLNVAGDGIGNVYLRLAGSDPTAAPVLTGSHLDSQPTGGRFDGTYGVLAGLEALQAIREAGINPVRSIEVVAWTNEEGSRFQPGCMGSAVFAEKLTLADALAITDWDGVTVREALADTLAATPDLPARRADGAAAYIEAHIEQGPLLENAGTTIGVVTGIQGARRYTITVTGEEAHAGTTPLNRRKDALKAAVAMVTALEEHMADEADIVRFTVGRFEVSPGSPNTVPGQALFTIDFRHPDAATIRRLCDKIAPICEANARGCAVTVQQLNDVLPTQFDPAVIDTVRQQAALIGLSHMDMFSGAGHDAIYMAGLCPTAMIFVPCERGISHNEAENARAADLAAGAQVLAASLVALAG